MKTGKKKEGKKMNNIMTDSIFFGAVISVVGYLIGIFFKKNFGFKSVACINNLCNRGYKDISH